MRMRHAPALALSLMVALGACTSTSNDADTTVSVEPSAGSVASPSPSEQVEAFPTAAFADISEDPVSRKAAAEFLAILNDMAGGAGMAATVMSRDGTWSGATGKADRVRDVRVDDQFFIASVTKSIIAAQVVQMVEAGELQLDDPATDHLPPDLDFDTNGATIRQLLAQRSGIPQNDFETEDDNCWRIRDASGRRPRCSSSSPPSALLPVGLSNTRTPTKSYSGW
jgi:CubicO group peptidase (beta-lactamase class C family)